jgi:DNA polymerase-3 subunit gamma/tau
MSDQLFEQGDQDASSSPSGSDSYRVIARRYRPSTFSEVIGQEHVTRTLRNAIKEDRLGHAYLFSGPRGIGKTSTARILARAVNCEKGVSAEPCNECDICRELEIGSTPDIIEIDAASQRGIDDIRNLRETVRYSPLNSTYRVYIIDESHMLSRDAFNAFLKTLEEPPDHVLFVFATTEPEKMPDTIVSRCQPFQFKRIPHSVMLDRLKEIVDNEGIAVDESILSDVCRAVDGSLRDAQSVLDQLISISEDGIDEEDLKLVLGTVPSDVLHHVLQGINEGRSDRILEQVNDIYQGGGEIDVFLDQFVSHLRDVLVVQSCGPDTELIDASEHETQRLAEQSDWFSRTDVSRMIEALVNVRSRTDDLYQSRLLLESKLVHLAEEFQGAPSTSTSAVPESNEENEGRVRESTGTSSTPEPDTTATSDERDDETDDSSSSRHQDPEDGDATDSSTSQEQAEPAEEPTEEESSVAVDDIEDVREHWEDVIDRLDRNHSTTAALLSEGTPKTLDGNTIVVEYEQGYEYHRDKLSEGDQNETLVEVIEDVFHHDLTVEFVLEEDTDDPETDDNDSSQEKNSDPGGPQKKIEDDPDVKKVIESFDADIINVEE